MNPSSDMNNHSSSVVYPSRKQVEAIQFPTSSEAFRDATKISHHRLPLVDSSEQPPWELALGLCLATNTPPTQLKQSPEAAVPAYPKVGHSSDHSSCSSSWASHRYSVASSDNRKPPARQFGEYHPTKPFRDNNDYYYSTASSLSSSRNRHYSSRGSSTTTTRRSSSMMQLEVTPGCFLPLHGSDETMQALYDKRLQPCHCLDCEAPLYCITVAAYVLCPQCRSLSPMPQQHYAGGSGGVGLGMTTREYMAATDEMERYQRRQNHERRAEASYW